MDSQWLAVEGAIPTSRARSALFNRFAERSAQARRNLSKCRRLMRRNRIIAKLLLRSIGRLASQRQISLENLRGRVS
jgi:hypothetical protein